MLFKIEPKQRKDLSVICPVYNNASTMLPMIASFQQQEIGSYEVEYIFVCNGCTDNSKEVLEKLVAAYPETFKNCTILNKKYCDTGRARQDGVDIALGKYILFCDMDDWLLSNTMFKELLDIEKKRPNTFIRFNLDLPKKDWFYIDERGLNYTTYWRLKNIMDCTVWRYLFPKILFKENRFLNDQHGKDDIKLISQIMVYCKNHNIRTLSLEKEYYYWNYMRPGSYSYIQMMKRIILTKEQFLEKVKQIPKENISPNFLEGLEHLL